MRNRILEKYEVIVVVATNPNYLKASILKRLLFYFINFHFRQFQIVDVRGQGPGDCADTFVYVADVSAFGVLVVDVARDRSWRVTHRLFFPYPNRGTFTIDGKLIIISCLTSTALT